MCCDVDETGVEYRQFVYCSEQCFGAVAFQRWKHFEGESALSVILFDILCYCHSSLLYTIRYKITTKCANDQKYSLFSFDIRAFPRPFSIENMLFNA